MKTLNKGIAQDELSYYLNHQERIFFNCLEEFAQNVVDQIHEVLVCLLFRERFFLGQDIFEQV